MNPLKLSLLLATGALLAFGASVQAQGTDVPKKITLQLLLRGEVEVETDSDSIFKTKFITMRAGTKEILQALGTAYGEDFTGASLVLIGDTVEVRLGTNVLADVTSYFYVESSDPVTAQTVNTETGKFNSRRYQAQLLSFDDGNGHSFTLNGLLYIERSASPANEEGEQQFSDVQTMTGAGSGDFEGHFVVVTGTITVKGKGKTTAAFEE